jgi:DNA-binding response OmpR family regulator
MVLIVDNHEDAADSTAELLRLSGFDTRIARNAHDAMTEVGAVPPDIILLELRLPDGDGCEVARRLGHASKPPFVIALTTCGQKADRDRSEAAGIDLHLLKPADPYELVKVLKRFATVVAPP